MLIIALVCLRYAPLPRSSDIEWLFMQVPVLNARRYARSTSWTNTKGGSVMRLELDDLFSDAKGSP